MKCKHCGNVVQDNWKICPFCGSPIEKKKHCLKCGAELQPNWVICPFCGESASIERLTPSFNDIDVLPNVDDTAEILPNVDDSGLDLVSGDILEAKQNQQSQQKEEYNKKLNLARIACIRKNFEHAYKIYEEIIAENPEDVNAYIGLIRIATKNYTEYVGKEIDEAIEIAEQIARKDIAKLDKDYAVYAKERPAKVAEWERAEKLRREEVERKAKLEAERIAREKAEGSIVQVLKQISLEKKRKQEEEEELFAMETAIYKDSWDIAMDGTLIKYKGKADVVEIPPCVTKIGHKAFYNDPFGSSVKKVTIHAGVTEIGSEAFRCCKDLRQVVFEKGSKLQSIGGGAFQYCERLDLGKLPEGVTYIGAKAFCDSNLSSITWPKCIKTIKCRTFESIQNPSFSIKIPYGVTRIEDEAFIYSKYLHYIELPESITYVGKDAFYKAFGYYYGGYGTILAPEKLDLSKSGLRAEVNIKRY